MKTFFSLTLYRLQSVLFIIGKESESQKVNLSSGLHQINNLFNRWISATISSLMQPIDDRY